MKKSFKIGCLVLDLLFVIVVVIAIWNFREKDNEETTTEPDKAPTEESVEEKSESVPDGQITLEKFEQVEHGMSYEEVADIIGSEGELVSESGEKGTDLYTVMYEWTEADEGFGNANFMFEDGTLTSKAQGGLGEGADSDVKITLEEFEQISNGMSYAEVQDIIGGEGELISEWGVAGEQYHAMTVTYYGESSGSDATLNFTEDKLETKTQFELE